MLLWGWRLEREQKHVIEGWIGNKSMLLKDRGQHNSILLKDGEGIKACY